MDGIVRKFITLLGSKKFWYLTIAFFLLQALWFIFSADYPMPFDEDFHLGVIKVYADQWTPFLSDQPVGADHLGALARDPSYFFHYLMSFPLRIVAIFTSSEAVQVVALRLINVVLFAYGLVLFRRVLLRATISPAMTHVILALFTLIPIVPQLAAHINYDNALMVLLPLLCLTVFNLLQSLRQGRFDGRSWLLFLTLALFISVVKYAALPFVAAAVIFLAVACLKYFRGRYHTLLPAFREGFATQAKRQALLLGLLCMIATGLFAQRYIVNIVSYGTPVPDCGLVLTTEQCLAYGPWGRDYYLAENRPADFDANPINYITQWLYGMWYRLFFAVSGPETNYQNYPPLVFPGAAAIAFGLTGIICCAIFWRQIFRGNPYLLFFAVLSLVYIIILWTDQFAMYRQTGEPVAVNGRYLLPVLPLLAAILGRAIARLVENHSPVRTKAILAMTVLLLFMHGGGVQTFILRSEDSWYWPNDTVRAVNATTHDVLSPFIVEGSREKPNAP